MKMNQRHTKKEFHFIEFFFIEMDVIPIKKEELLLLKRVRLEAASSCPEMCRWTAADTLLIFKDRDQRERQIRNAGLC